MGLTPGLRLCPHPLGSLRPAEEEEEEEEASPSHVLYWNLEKCLEDTGSFDPLQNQTLLACWVQVKNLTGQVFGGPLGSSSATLRLFPLAPLPCCSEMAETDLDSLGGKASRKVRRMKRNRRAGLCITSAERMRLGSSLSALSRLGI